MTLVLTRRKQVPKGSGDFFVFLKLCYLISIQCFGRNVSFGLLIWLSASIHDNSKVVSVVQNILLLMYSKTLTKKKIPLQFSFLVDNDRFINYAGLHEHNNVTFHVKCLFTHYRTAENNLFCSAEFPVRSTSTVDILKNHFCNEEYSH